MCTKLSDDEFENNTYFFCNKRCENSVEISENISREVLEVNPNSRESRENLKNALKNARIKKEIIKSLGEKSIRKHFLDISCSYMEPNRLNSTFLSNENSDLVVFHNNVRSLNKNFHKIEEIFKDCKKLPEILAVSETWLNDESPIPTLKGYKFEKVNASCTKNNVGGVGAYLSNQLDYDIRDDLSMNYHGAEDLWLNVKLKKSIIKTKKA